MAENKIDRAVFPPSSTAKQLVPPLRQVAWQASLLYWLLASLWILLSDQLVEQLSLDIATTHLVQTYKGWAFVTVTALLLYLFLRRQLRRWEKTESAVRERDLLFRNVFNQQFQFMAILSPDGRVREINDLPLQVTGYKREDYLGKFVWETPGWKDLPEWHDIWQARLQKAAASSAPVLTQDIYQRAGGAIGYADAATTAVRNRDGELECFIIQATDTTERRKAEAAMRESEERYRTLVMTTAQVVWMMDAAGNLTDVFNIEALGETAGEAVEATTPERAGATGDEADADLRQVNWFSLIHEDDRERVRTEYVKALREGVPLDVECRARHGDGTYHYYFTRVVPIFASAGGVREWIGTSTDISKRKVAEIELRQSEERFSRAFRSSPAAFVISRLKDGRIFDINEKFLALTGYTREEVLNRTTTELGFITAEQRRRLLPNLFKAEGSLRDIEAQIHTKTGEARTVLFSLESISLEQEPCLLSILYDITERKYLEEQLRHSQKMEAIGQLAGGVAHDFNNLLTVIIGFSDILLAQLPQDERADEMPQRSLIGNIKHAGVRAASLTRQLLAFSHKQILEPKIVAVNEIVSNTEKMLQRLIGEDINLTTALSTELDCVRVDPGQMEQVIINLAVNARDAMPQGGTLLITTQNVVFDEAYCRRHPGTAPGGYVQLSMTDTGCGMSEATLAHIFEPFFTTKGVGKGTGLGLATVFGIIKQSGGVIEVESEVGKGSTFRISLPAVELRRPLPMPEAELPATQTGSETILLVEDEEAVRSITKLTLETFGYTVIEACNGRAALPLAKEHEGTIDLLITDMVMPEMGGKQLAAALRADYPQLQVLFMSGYIDDAVIRQGIIGANEPFLQKPFLPLALAKKVREVLDKKLGE